ncbi:MAG: D-lyxose/D-mannose family sugar isomerase [Promethearchaeota archaeon]
MKRSEINYIMQEAIKFLEKQSFYLPKFAYWKLEDWKKIGREIDEIFDVNLGWDINAFFSEHSRNNPNNPTRFHKIYLKHNLLLSIRFLFSL